MSAVLMLKENNGDKNYTLGDGVTTIGRAIENVIAPLNSTLSRSHAKIECKDGDWYLEDCGSTNGTVVNGSKIAVATKLASGDKIKFGDLEGEFTIKADQPEATVTPIVKPIVPVVPIVPNVKPIITEVKPIVADIKPVLPSEVGATPVSPATPISPIKPIVKPIVGGVKPIAKPGMALKPGIKLPPKPTGLRPGLKLPPKPGLALKPGLKLPPKPGLKLPVKPATPPAN